MMWGERRSQIIVLDENLFVGTWAAKDHQKIVFLYYLIYLNPSLPFVYPCL